MGQPNEYYVDPAAGNDTTGDGSIGTPWATVQHALDNITRDTTDGDRINLKAGTSDVLSSALSGSTYGNGSVTAPLIIQGYTSTAGDGGVGVIDGNATVACLTDSSRQFWTLKDLRFTNAGANQTVFIGANNQFDNVRIDTGTGGGLRCGNSCSISASRFENLSGFSLRLPGNGSSVKASYFKNGANSATAFVQLEGNSVTVTDNIFNASGSTDCLSVLFSGHLITRNRFYSSGGTGQGVVAGGSSTVWHEVSYNYIEGFSGTGGVGIQTDNAGTPPDISLLRQNYYYNNATNKSLGDVYHDEDGSTLSGSAFVDAANEDFSINDTAGAGAVLRAVERVLVS